MDPTYCPYVFGHETGLEKASGALVRCVFVCFAKISNPATRRPETFNFAKLFLENGQVKIMRNKIINICSLTYLNICKHTYRALEP
mgnify:CR=1 FL=1